MIQNFIIAFVCWVFELNVTTLILVGIHSFEDGSSQCKNIVASCNYKELERSFKPGNIGFWKV